MRKSKPTCSHVVIAVALVFIVLFSFCKPQMPYSRISPEMSDSAVSITPSEPGFRYCTNIWEYLEFIMTYDLPFGFVSWEQVSMLGRIQSVAFYGGYDRQSWRIAYKYIDSTGAEVNLYLDYGGYTTRYDKPDDSIADFSTVDISAIVFEAEKTYEENALCVRLFSEDEVTAKTARTELYLKLALGKVISILLNLVLMVIPVGAVSAIVIVIYKKKKKKAAGIAPPTEEPAE